MYLGNKIQIKQRNPIKINGGVRQGCPLSTALFNLFLDEIVWIWLTSVNGGIRIALQMLKNLMFTDDQIIIGHK